MSFVMYLFLIHAADRSSYNQVDQNSLNKANFCFQIQKPLPKSKQQAKLSYFIDPDRIGP